MWGILEVVSESWASSLSVLLEYVYIGRHLRTVIVCECISSRNNILPFFLDTDIGVRVLPTGVDGEWWKSLTPFGALLAALR